jgi:spore germination protein YaaH
VFALSFLNKTTMILLRETTGKSKGGGKTTRNRVGVWICSEEVFSVGSERRRQTEESRRTNREKKTVQQNLAVMPVISKGEEKKRQGRDEGDASWKEK